MRPPPARVPREQLDEDQRAWAELWASSDSYDPVRAAELEARYPKPAGDVPPPRRPPSTCRPPIPGRGRPPAPEVSRRAVTVKRPGGGWDPFAYDGVSAAGSGGRQADGDIEQLGDFVATLRSLSAAEDIAVYLHETVTSRLLGEGQVTADGWGAWAARTVEAAGLRCRTIGNGGWTVIDGSQRVHLVPVGVSGEFGGAVDAAGLGAAVEAFRKGVGFEYRYSAASTVKSLIKATTRLTEPDVHPEIDGYTPSAWRVRSHVWQRALTGDEIRTGWVRAFDRNASYLAAWGGLTLAKSGWVDGSWPLTGTESSKPPGYWLIDTAALNIDELPDPFARAGDGPVWLTTPLAHLAQEIADRQNVALEPLRVVWATDRWRPLDGAAKRLNAARASLDGAAGRLAWAAVKDGYATVTGQMGFTLQPPDPLARPDWARAIWDRNAANTWRALDRCPQRPFALTHIDTALFAVDNPDAVPTGLDVSHIAGKWKPAGIPVPMADALQAYEDTGAAGILRLAGG